MSDLKRVKPPDYYATLGPTCPDCGKPLAYLGTTLVLGADTVLLNDSDRTVSVSLGNRLYQCAGCKTVWEAVK